MMQTENENRCGQLSKLDILRECDRMLDGSQQEHEGEPSVPDMNIIPFDPTRLQSASYDLSPTMVAMSVKLGMLEKVYKDARYPYRYYIYVKPKDTVLILSKEYVKLPYYMSGYVTSRVSKVIQGFGHVCTSIDPKWQGALLIALSNPSNKPIQIFVGEDVPKLPNKNSLVSISFHYLNTSEDAFSCDYPGMRLDLLESKSYLRRTGVRAALEKWTHPFRCRYTDFFFAFCQTHQFTEATWMDVVKEFSGMEKTDEQSRPAMRRHYLHFNDFIIKEHIFVKIYYWIRKRPWAMALGALLLLILLNRILPETVMTKIRKLVDAFLILIGGKDS